MTKNQILYQELQQTKYRDEQNIKIGLGNLEESKRHNTVVETETERHNRATEEQNLMHLGIEQYNAETGRLNYGVNLMNAETNRYNAETNRLNYNVNLMNAETNRLNYGVNAMNAQSNRMQAQAALQNAATNALAESHNYQLGVMNWGVSQYNAETQRYRMSNDYELGKFSNVTARIQAQAAEYNAETNRLKYESEDRVNRANIDWIDSRRYGQDLLNQNSVIDLQYAYDIKEAQLLQTYSAGMVNVTQAILNMDNRELVSAKVDESQSSAIANLGRAFKDYIGGLNGLGSLLGGLE